jgi:hypothetical protein
MWLTSVLPPLDVKARFARSLDVQCVLTRTVLRRVAVVARVFGIAGEQPKRRLWECRACGRQTSVTAGTVMHGTHTPLQLSFWAAYLVAIHHPGISAVQLQRQLGISRYESAWLVLHKLRRAMVAPDRELLTGPAEGDEFQLGGRDDGKTGAHRLDSKKVLVAIAVERRGAGSGRMRLAVVPDASADSLCGFVAAVLTGATVHTDAWQSYRRGVNTRLKGAESDRAMACQLLGIPLATLVLAVLGYRGGYWAPPPGCS